MQRHVFISHSAKDAHLARRIADALRSAGVRPWMAPGDIDPGADWGAAIATAVADCGLMILVLTAHSNISRQVVREVQLADAGNHPIIPLRMEALELSPSLKYFLSAAQWLDATELSEAEMLRELVDTVLERAAELTAPEAGAATPAHDPPAPAPAAPPPAVPPPRTGPVPQSPTKALPRAAWAAAAVAGLGSIYVAAQAIGGDRDVGKQGVDSSVVRQDSAARDTGAALAYRPDSGSPPWLRFAWEEQGIMEYGDNYLQSRVFEYMQAVHGDSTPTTPGLGWSAAFVNWALGRAGYRGTGSYAGRTFLQWGTPAEGLREGCVIVLTRPGNPNTAHTGFFLVQRRDSVYVLSGNVGKRVAVTPYRLDRVAGCRYPAGYQPPIR